jgi:hypothetical protein
MLPTALTRLVSVLLFGPAENKPAPRPQCEKTPDEQVAALRKEWREAVHDVKNSPMRAAAHLRTTERDAKDTVAQESQALKAATEMLRVLREKTEQ